MKVKKLAETFLQLRGRGHSTDDILAVFDKALKRGRRKRGGPGVVYFVQIAGPEGPDSPVKVGYSTNIEGRLETISTANPYPLRLLAVVPGTRETEAALHKEFADLRIRREWFRPDARLRQRIAALNGAVQTSRPSTARAVQI